MNKEEIEKLKQAFLCFYGPVINMETEFVWNYIEDNCLNIQEENTEILRLRKEVKEWELWAKAANEAIEERNNAIDELQKECMPNILSSLNDTWGDDKDGAYQKMYEDSKPIVGGEPTSFEVPGTTDKDLVKAMTYRGNISQQQSKEQAIRFAEELGKVMSIMVDNTYNTEDQAGNKLVVIDQSIVATELNKLIEFLKQEDK